MRAATRLVPMLVFLLLNACVQMQPTIPQTDKPPPEERPVTTPPERKRVVVDPMAVVIGDRALPVAQGPLERIDCLSGEDELHARVALEARGSQVTSFAYYSRWQFYTCSIDLDQGDAKTRWRLTEDGATRVQTPFGSFLIRSDAENYTIEFRDVQRKKYCGMDGRIRGVLTIKRNTDPPQCSATGILDR